MRFETCPFLLNFHKSEIKDVLERINNGPLCENIEESIKRACQDYVREKEATILWTTRQQMGYDYLEEEQWDYIDDQANYGGQRLFDVIGVEVQRQYYFRESIQEVEQ